MISGAVSVHRAIVNTDQNLRHQLPAIATIRQDEEAISHALDEEIDIEGIEVVRGPLIREIGQLPYVRLFDYTAWGFNFFSDSLIRVFDRELFLDLGVPQESIRDVQSLRYHSINFEQFILKGVHHPDVADIEAGLIQLVEGRTFTADEVENSQHVVIVSQSFLDNNNLYLGGNLEIDYRIYHEESGALILEEHFSEVNLLGYQTFELEIIGVFDHELEMDDDLVPWEIAEHFNIINRIYVPNGLVESTVDLYLDIFPEDDPLIEEIVAAEALEDIIQYEHIVFLLNDPSYLAHFNRAATELLPKFWVVSDLSNAYAPIASSMENMQEIADTLLIGAVSAAIITISLLVLLLVYDRKQEIGVYLALGERRIKLAIQVLLETMMISTISITFALLVGNFLAGIVSTEMIARDVSRQLNEEQFLEIDTGTPESMGFRIEMTEADMMEAYDLGLTLDVIFVFYTTALGVIIIATLMPMTYILNLKPKDILLKSTIG